MTTLTKWVIGLSCAVLVCLAGCGDDDTCALEGDFCIVSWDCCPGLKCRSFLTWSGGWFELGSVCVPRDADEQDTDE